MGSRSVFVPVMRKSRDLLSGPGLRAGRVALCLLAFSLLAAACSATSGSATPGSTTTTGHATRVAPLSEKKGPDPRTVAVAAATCPAHRSFFGSAGSLNAEPFRGGLKDVLVPSGPVAMTICRYAGLNMRIPVGTLEKTLVIRSHQELSDFVSLVDQKTWQAIKPGLAVNCPMSTGRVDILRFVYASGPGVTISVNVDGCELVSNGFRTVWAGPIAQRVTAWVGVDPD
jgi:hypothetical protein